MNGTLYIVGTPIGNLGDITLRALETLKSVDAIFCEDTRVTAKLLARHIIKKPLFRLDAVTERIQAPEVIERLRRGESIAYVTDAGTPGGVSDPGAYLVASVRAGVPDGKIVPIPGPSAITTALSVAGMPADDFLFLGFLPHKKGRKTALDGIAKTERTIVLFESPHRIGKLMDELVARMPERRAVVLRELTKMFESVVAGTVVELAEKVRSGGIPAKGEFVVILAPH